AGEGREGRTQVYRHGARRRRSRRASRRLSRGREGGPAGRLGGPGRHAAAPPGVGGQAREVQRRPAGGRGREGRAGRGIGRARSGPGSGGGGACSVRSAAAVPRRPPAARSLAGGGPAPTPRGEVAVEPWRRTPPATAGKGAGRSAEGSHRGRDGG